MSLIELLENTCRRKTVFLWPHWLDSVALHSGSFSPWQNSRCWLATSASGALTPLTWQGDRWELTGDALVNDSRFAQQGWVRTSAKTYEVLRHFWDKNWFKMRQNEGRIGQESVLSIASLRLGTSNPSVCGSEPDEVGPAGQWGDEVI